MTIEEQRKAFDAYFKDKYPELYKDVFDEDGDDRAIIGYSFALSAWLASANREGYKLVPVETLEESLSWASIAKWDSPSKESDLEIEKHEKIIEAMIGACDDH